MNRKATGLLALLLSLILTDTAKASECVILLHGLARSAGSMKKLESALAQNGYSVINVDYPSRKHDIPTLTDMVIEPALLECANRQAERIHVATHSLGGILIRYYLANKPIEKLGRVVMLAPPNQGSQVVDALRKTAAFRWLNGKAGQQLGTTLPESIPASLGPVDFDLGIIAGTRSINGVLSLYLPNPDDGKVSVANTKVEGMRDFLEVPYSHPFIMQRKRVISEVIAYFKSGRFTHDAI